MSQICLNLKNLLLTINSFLGGFRISPKTPFRKKIIFAIIAFVIFVIFGLETLFVTKVQAATGVRHIINFQGKVVNSDGTNVADGLYRFQFNIYTVSSGGAAVWTEDRNNANKVQVTGGIFQVQLGSVTTLPGSVDFNTDNIYLGITFHTEGSEMTPRIQFATVPQAFNAEKVNGLTVVNTSGNSFGSTTTFRIGDGKTVSINNGLTFTGTDSTSFAFPSTGGNVVTEDFAQTLTNKTIGSTGLTFTGATTDVTTGTNEDFSIVPNGMGKVNINTTSGLASLDVRANSVGGGTIAVASISGTTSFATLIVDNRGVGEIFTASTGGVAKFTILNTGQIRSSNYTANGGILYTGTTGIISQTAGGSNGNCLTFTGGLPAWGSCAAGGTGGLSNWTIGPTGYIRPNNGTLDVLFGLNATNASSSAKFAILNLGDDSATNNPSASVSAITGNSAGKGVSINGDGSIQSFRNNTLTIGGNTTGNINLIASNSNGNIGINTANPVNWIDILTSGASKKAFNIGHTLGNGTGLASTYRPFNLSVNYTATDLAAATNSWQGIRSEINYGTGGVAAMGTVHGFTSDVIIGGSGSLSNESTPYYSTLRYDIGTGYTQTAGPVGRAWLSDYNLHGPIAVQTGLLNGLSVFMNNHYNGSPADAPSGGMWIQTDKGNGGGRDTNHQNANTYAIDVGVGIIGTSNNGAEGISFNKAIQIGGSGGGWGIASSRIGTGVDLRDYINYGIYIHNRHANAVANAPGIAIDTGAGGLAIGSTTTGTRLLDVLSTTTLDPIARFGGGTSTAHSLQLYTNNNDVKLFVTNFSGGFLTNTGSLDSGVAFSGGAFHIGNQAFGNTIIYAKSNGQVGLGTAAPQGVVHISGGTQGLLAGLIVDQVGNSINDIFAASASGTTKFVIKNDGTASSAAGFTINGVGNIQSTKNQTLTIGGNTTGKIQFQPGNSSSSLFLSSNGFVGVGISDPTEILHLYKSTGNFTTARFDSAATQGYFFSYDGDNSVNFGSNSNSTVNFKSNNTTKATILSNGAFGIGATSPIAELHVTRPLSFGVTGKALAIFDQIENQDILTASAGGATKFTVTNGGFASASAGFTIDGIGNIQSTNAQLLTVGGATTGDIFFKPGNSTSSLYLSSGGNVGIGTTFPGAALDVVGSLLLGANSTIDTRASGTLNIGTAANTTGLTLGRAGNTTIFNSTSWTATPTISGLITDTTGIALGTTPAAAGILRIPNNTFITARNAANNADINLIKIDASNLVNFGVNLAAHTLGGDITGNSQNITTLAGMTINGGGTITSATSGTLGVGTSTNTTALTLGNAGTNTNVTLNVGTSGNLILQRNGAAINCSGQTNGGKLTTDASGNVSCSGDVSGGGGAIPTFDIVNGALFPANQTVDFLFGGTTTASAAFKLHKNGTDSVASIAANTSFAGLVVDQRGVGDIFTASKSGMTAFTIRQDRGVSIGTRSNDGFTFDVDGDARIGSFTQLDDVVKTTTTDFTVTGSTATNVTTTQDKVTLKINNVGGAPATAAGPPLAMGTPSTGTLTFQRPDGKIVVMNGGATTTNIYDPATNTFGAGLAANNAPGPGAQVFQRNDGKFVIVVGNSGTNVSVYDPVAGTQVGTYTTNAGTGLTSAAVGAGSQLIRRQNGSVLLIHGGAATSTSYYGTLDATQNTFRAGPVLVNAATTGSFAFQRPDGKWIVGMGGATTTNIYDPTTANGGGFVAGPSLSAGTPGAGTHVIQLADGRFMVLIGGSTATQIYDPKTNAFSAGAATTTATIGAGSHSFQKADGKWITIIGGGASAVVNLYDMINNSFSNPSQNLQANAGAGSITFQRQDGKYLITSAGSATTSLFDAGWGTNGIWESEDINSTKISTYSALLWQATPQQSASDASGMVFQVKTARNQVSLANVPYVTIQNSGDLINASWETQWAKMRVLFGVKVPTLYTQNVPIQVQGSVWMGDGATFYQRQMFAPTLFNLRLQNPLAGYGGWVTADSSQGRNAATQSALLDNVVSDNQGRLSLAPTRYTTVSATASAGIQLASASANLGVAAGSGANSIVRPDGKILIIAGNTSTNTRIYDPVTGQFTPGPNTTVNIGANTFSFQLPDGKFLVVIGTTANPPTNIYDPVANVFSAGPSLNNPVSVVGAGAHAFQRSDGKFIIFRGGAGASGVITDIYDPVTNAVVDGPRLPITATVGAGAFSFRRPDGRIVINPGGGLLLPVAYDPNNNQFVVGATWATGTNTNGSAIQLANGNIFMTRTTTTSQIYDINTGTIIAGPAMLSIGVGSHMVQMNDGRILVFTGNGTGYQVVDPATRSDTATTGVLPLSIGAGSHSIQLPNGKYLLIAGGNSTNTMIVDVGSNVQGTYITEPLNIPSLSTSTALFWKNIGNGNINVKYRTGASALALGVAGWNDFEKDDGNFLPNPGDTWVQIRFDFQGGITNQPFERQRVWGNVEAGLMVYYRAPLMPIMQYWRLQNNQDPNTLVLQSNGRRTFRFGADGQAYTANNGAWNAGGADLAERYSSVETLKAGEVVTQDFLHPTFTRRSTASYDPNIMGVVSTTPGFVAGAFTENSQPIALVGRVPVKVSTENGEIKAGDYLTSASIPGYAMKATVGGRVLGQAMEDLTIGGRENCPTEGMGNLPATQCGTITVFVNLTDYNGKSVNVALTESGYKLDEKNLPQIAGIDFTPGTDDRHQQEILSFLKTQKDHGQSIYTDHLASTQDVISPKIVTDLLIAKKIKAESIEGLEILTNNIEQLSQRVASGSSITNFSDRLTDLSHAQLGITEQMASLSASLEKMKAVNLLSFAATSTSASDLVMVNNLAAYGTTTLSDASVMSTLSVGGTMTFGSGSINTIGTNLELQPLKQGGINFLGGLITFASDGKVTFKEDVVFEKNVAVQGVLSAHTVSSTELLLGQSEVKVLEDGSVESTGAAGLITMKKNTKEIKIANPLVKEKSLIFITPKTRTTQPLFLLNQVDGKSFSVGTDALLDIDVKFNYLIVN